MKRTAAALATLLAAGTLALGAAPAQAVTAHHGVAKVRFGLPMCIATTWASHYYQQPKTAKGARCWLPMRLVHDPLSSPNVHSYSFAWTPANWEIAGYWQSGDRFVAAYVIMAMTTYAVYARRGAALASESI